MYKHLTVCKQKHSGSFINFTWKNVYNSYNMYKEDLALNDLQGLIWHKTETNKLIRNSVRNFIE